MRKSLGPFLRHLLGASLHLSIGSLSVTLSQNSTSWKKPLSVLADQPLIPTQLKNQCDILLAHPSCSALPLSITLHDMWGRLFIVTPPKNAAQFSDLIAAATMRFQTLYGKDNDEWEINAEWQMGHPFLACAYPRSLLTMLQEAAKERGHLLLSVKPYFVMAWNLWRSKINSSAWFGVVQDEVVTLGIISELPATSLIGIRSIPIHGHTIEWLAEQLTRIALQNNVAQPKQIQLVGNVYGYWKNSSGEEQVVINLEEPHENTSS
jgi:hypothetical protein